MAAEHILLGQIVDAWKMICPLVRLHSLQKFDRDRPVIPRDIPCCIHPLRQMVLEVELGDFFYDIVMRMIGVHNEAICFVCHVFWIKLTFLIIFITRSEPI